MEILLYKLSNHDVRMLFQPQSTYQKVNLATIICECYFTTNERFTIM